MSGGPPQITMSTIVEVPKPRILFAELAARNTLDFQAQGTTLSLG